MNNWTGSISKSRWYRLIPVVFITYSLAYLDRANFGFGLAGGMANDLHITPASSSLLGSMFFLGYFCFQIPGVYYGARNGARILIFWSLILWGLFATATGLISNLSILIVIRFMLGAVEGAVLPSLLLLLSRWFTKGEKSRANTFLIFGNPATICWMSVISGYLINSFGWRWMFIGEGIPAILWAFFWLFVVSDKPKDANWLHQDEKKYLENKLLEEQQLIKPVKNQLSVFKSKLVLALCLTYCFWSMGVYGFVIWLPSIIKAAPGINIIKTGWLSAVPYILAIVGMLTAAHFSDKTLKRKPFVWPFLLIAAITFYCSYLIGPGHFWISFLLLIIAGMAMYAPYGPFFSIITEILPENVAGVAIALINSLGALGSFAGSYIVGLLNGAAGGFGAGYLFMAVALLFSAVLVILILSNSSGTGYLRATVP
jgi:sugar phosphate permease